MNKKIGDIILKSVILVLLVISLFVNSDYKEIKDYSLINDSKSYELNKDKRYVSIDLSNAIETRFMIEKDNNYKTYIVSYNDFSLLVVLQPNSVLTSSVKLMKEKDSNESLDIKTSYSKENNNIIYKNGYYTNVNLSKNEKIVNIKQYVTYIFVGLLIIFIIYDIILYFKNKQKINTITI